MCDSLTSLHHEIMACRRCPRLVAWREETAAKKVRRFLAEPYWGKPLPGFGAHHARLVVVGLAPAAHGGNRTGRMFTGDASADWLMAAMHESGFANQPQSLSRTDGLVLNDAYITAAVRCAPPQNKPTGQEAEACAGYLAEELNCLQPRVILALGRFAFGSVRKYLKGLGVDVHPLLFSHGAHFELAAPCPGRLTLLASYHPSQQNTQTGKLTRPMFAEVFHMARMSLGAAQAE